MMIEQQERYLRFVADTLRGDGHFDESWKQIDWNGFFEFARQQAVSGVVFDGMQMLGSEIKGRVGMKVLLEWYSLAESIKRKNRQLNQRAVEVTQLFADAGFRSCILKGQGNTLMYPNPYVRMSGDIDIWIDGKRDEIKEFVKSHCPDAYDGDLHIYFPVFSDAIVEVHYKPSHLGRPRSSRRLQQWTATQAGQQFSHHVRLPDTDADVCIPLPEFNLIQQMAHLCSHFFIEGIGLRQFVDYYYVLKTVHQSRSAEYEAILSHIGLLKFARGVLWIEQHCLGAEDGWMVVEPDEQVGRFILTELLEGGNFGYYDQRYTTRKKGYLARGLTDTVRLLRLVPVFPVDALWKVLRKIENQRWKLQSLPLFGSARKSIGHGGA